MYFLFISQTVFYSIGYTLFVGLFIILFQRIKRLFNLIIDNLFEFIDNLKVIYLKVIYLTQEKLFLHYF